MRPPPDHDEAAANASRGQGATDKPRRRRDVPPLAPPAPPPPALEVDTTGLVRPKAPPPVSSDNQSNLIRSYRRRLTLTASSTWGGWPPENAVDDDIQTSWFSGRNDAAAKGTTPWLQVNFPADVPVRRVTVLGNRDPAWLIDFTILEGSVTLHARGGNVLKAERNGGRGTTATSTSASTRRSRG